MRWKPSMLMKLRSQIKAGDRFRAGVLMLAAFLAAVLCISRFQEVES
jgi:hypothetical protein